MPIDLPAVHAPTERLRSLYERKASTWRNMETILETARGENRDLSDEERGQFDAADAELTEITETIGREERSRTLADAFSRVSVPSAIQGGGDGDGQAARGSLRASPEYRAAWDRYVRRGENGLTSEQRDLLLRADEESRALSIGTASAGGYLVPEGFAGYVTRVLDTFNAVRRFVAVTGGGAQNPLVTENGAPIPFPTADDTGVTGELIAENDAVTNDNEPSFGEKTLNAYIFSSREVRASYALIEDSAVDMEQYIATLAGERIARIENTYDTTGTGSSQPEGLVASAATVAGLAVSAISYADTVNLHDGVSEAYRNTGLCAWMSNQATQSSLKKLLDGNDRPLWEPSLQAGAPDRYMGFPYIVNAAMANMGASAKSLAFGHGARYQIRDVRSVIVLRLNEIGARNLQVSFIGFHRHDARNLDTTAVKVLAHPAN